MPDEWRRALVGEVAAIWVEGTVSVDHNGLPIDYPSPIVRPIAVEFVDRILLVIEMVEDTPTQTAAAAGYPVDTAYHGVAFIITNKNVDELLKQTFINMLSENFSKEPIVALPSREEEPPDQVVFNRKIGKSLVLTTSIGANHDEDSTYVANIWIVPTSDPQVRHLKLKIRHVLMIAISGDPKYYPPTDAQSEEYKKQIDKIVDSSIKQTSEKLKGSITNIQNRSVGKL